MIATAPAWVSDVGVWTGATLGIAAVLTFMVKLIGRAQNEAVDKVKDIVDKALKPVNERLDKVSADVQHLHDCTEGMKADVAAMGAVTQDTNEKLTEHAEDDRLAFAEAKDSQRDLHTLVDTVLGIRRGDTGS